MRAGELCSREVVVCEGTATVTEAAQLMREHHVGTVVVVEERRFVRVPVGILTDRDVAVGVVARRLDPSTTRVAEVLVGEIVTAREEDDLLEVLEKMRLHGIRRIPVVDAHGGLRGIVTFDDVVEVMSEVVDSLASVAETQPLFESRVRS